MSNIYIIVIMLSSFLMSAFITCILVNSKKLLDHPNDRSLHAAPIPKGGGVAILISLLAHSSIVAVWYTIDAHMLFIVIGLLLVSIVSYIDDHFNLSVQSRLFVHIVSACLLILSGLSFNVIYISEIDIVLPAMMSLFFTIIFIIWMVNLYNFMDGMDGFAAGMGVFGFGSFAILAFLENDILFFSICLVIVFSLVGFLIFNFPPARIFMGDVGSSSLGFLLAALTLWGEKRKIIYLWEAMLLFSPFIVDATVTLIRRLIQGEKFWQAHKSHYYQKLVLLGWGHKKTVLVEYVVMFACSFTVILLHYQSVEMHYIAIVLWIIFYILTIIWIPRLANK